MTNEIKEILEYIEDKNIYVDEYDYCYKRISLEECRELSKYITNLQEDLANYVNVILHNRKVIDNLQQRIDKALKYIKKQKPWWEEWHYDMCGVDDDIEEIVNILRGNE